MKVGRKVLALIAGVGLATAAGCVCAKTHREALEAEKQATQAETARADEAAAGLAKAQDEIKTLSETSAALEKALSAEKEKATALQGQLKKAQDEAAAAKRETAKLTQQIAGLKTDLAASAEKVKALTAELENLKKMPAPADE